MVFRRLLTGFAAAAVLGIVGCGSGSTASATGSEAGELKVALLTPGSVSDAGWNAMAYDGLQAIKSDLGAQVDNQEATGAKSREAMRSYAQKGYKLVFGHGFEYNQYGAEVAKDFPETTFVSSSGGETAPNAGAFRFYLEQGFYLAGYMAAKMSKTGTIGSVAVLDVPSINSTLKAFEAGAKAARPDIKVLKPVYFGDDKDVAKAKQATEEVVRQGADFVIHQANAGAQGVFDAAKEKGIYAFGSNADQNENESGAVIASAVIVARPAFVELAKKVKEGTYKGEVSLYGMDKDAIDFVINPVLKAKVPADLVTELETLKADIKSGKVVVPKDEF